MWTTSAFGNPHTHEWITSSGTGRFRRPKVARPGRPHENKRPICLEPGDAFHSRRLIGSVKTIRRLDHSAIVMSDIGLGVIIFGYTL